MDYGRIAELHDPYANTTMDIPFFLHAARRADGAVLELMSGTGGVSIPLLEAGIPLACVDSSAEMLAVLRRKLAERGPAAEVRQADVTRLSLSRTFDLILIPFHSFSGIAEEEVQRAALRAIATHLRDGGRFICTLHNPANRLRTEDGTPRVLAEAAMDDGGRLRLTGVGTFDPGSRTVRGQQIYERLEPSGAMISRMRWMSALPS
jgi:SAM-dependent methyltransferase